MPRSRASRRQSRRTRPRRSRRAAAPVGIISAQAMCGIGARFALIGDGLLRVMLVPWREHFARAFEVVGRVDAERERRRRGRCRSACPPPARAIVRAFRAFPAARAEGRRSARAPRADRRRGRCGGERPLAPGRARPGEIERAQPARRDFGPDRLDDVGVVALLGAPDRRRRAWRCRRRDREGANAARTLSASIVGRSPCTLTTLSIAPAGSNLQPPRRSGRSRRACRLGQDRPPPAAAHRVDDFARVGRHQHRADIGLHRPAPDLDDHRLAVDIGERLAGQAGRGHAGGNDDESGVLRHDGRQDLANGGTSRRQDIGFGGGRRAVGLEGLYVLPSGRQSVYQFRYASERDRPDSRPFRRVRLVAACAHPEILGGKLRALESFE